MRRSTLRALTALLALVFVLSQGTWALAETTGTLNGTVTVQGGAPLSGASVTVSSPSQQATTTTDAAGRFSFLSLGPDTYTVTITHSGYQTITQPGVTVQSNQVSTLSFTADRALQTIGSVTSRARSELIRPGTTTDVYSINPAQQSAAAPLGGGGSLNQAYSAIASVPGVFVPIGQESWGQSVYVRGGNYTQLGYEFDGVPVQRAYDAYPSSALSALGQQELQVYTGSQPGSAQSSGLAGFVNQVIRTGTYPGTGDFELGVGAPAFYHKAQVEYGGATSDRNFSYYLATAGYNQGNRIIDPYNGSRYDQLYSSIPFASISANCGTPQATAGCYQNGFGSAPNGYVWAPVTYGNDQYYGDRETIGNIHFGWPHPKDGMKDDIQLLGQVSYLFLNFQDSLNSFGPMAVNFFKTGNLNFNGTTYPTCGAAGVPAGAPCANNIFGVPGTFAYNNRSIYTGPTGGALTAANLSQVSQYGFPNMPTGLPQTSATNFSTRPVDPNNNGNEKINDGILKLQYTHQMGSNAFARIYGYTLYSDWLNNDPNASSNGSLAFVPTDYILPTHTRGLGFTLADQLGNHLLDLTGGYTTANLSRWNNSLTSTGNPVAVLVDSTNPTNGLCYGTTAGGAIAASPVYCGGSSAARYTIPTTNAAPTGLVARGNNGITVNNASTFTCGAGPCEYLAVGSGLNGSYNNVTPKFTNVTLSDNWRVNSKLSVNAALRYDSFLYDLPAATSPGGPNPPGTASSAGRIAFTNSYNQFFCFSQATGAVPRVAGACPAGTQPVNFNINNPSQFWYGGLQPRFGATFSLDAQNVFRAAYGRFLQPTSTAYLFYNRAGADIASYDVPKFYGFGFTSAAHDIPPQESWNLDFSWEHQVRNSDLSWKVTPFLRRTRNENINVVLDPTTNFVSGIDALSSNIRGVELAVRKGDFNRQGWSGQLAYTYTFVTSRYQTLPGGATALDNVNQSVKTYNGYTSFCATNPNDPRCGTPTNGLAAAPCYAADGTPAPGCGPGSFANPYWNAPVQSLFDPNANYYPYNQTFGTGFSSNASSYNIPHVATLILNYKHNRWNFTPTVQFTAGGRYGSPVQGIGIDPASGCSTLAGTTTGDPRYPYGAAGGAPYDAQSCPGFITAPNPFTARFDTPGAFREPNELLANLSISYEASKRVTLNLVGVNVFGTCWGGTQAPWTNAGSKIGCWYGSASGFQAGNFYNPGNTMTPQAMPYFPVTGFIAGQQAYGTAINPLQLFLTATVKL